MTIIQVKVTPNAHKNQIVGWREDFLCVRIQAPAVRSQANRELLRFLAEELEISKERVVLVSHPTARYKRIAIIGLSLEEILERLE